MPGRVEIKPIFPELQPELKDSVRFVQNMDSQDLTDHFNQSRYLLFSLDEVRMLCYNSNEL